MREPASGAAERSPDGGVTRSLDVVALVLVVVVTLVALVGSLHADRSIVDVDEAVYSRTLEGMRSGEGYYDATRTALVAKEGLPPSQVRSVRPPTLFLVLRWVPPPAWRWVAAAVCLVSLLLAWRLARSVEPLAGPVAVVLVGAYLQSATPYLYLHSELWGLPLALGALLAMRGRRWVWAAVLLVGAVALRELYLVYLVAAIAWVPRRRAFVVGGAAVAAAAAVHFLLASRILVVGGREAPFANETGIGHALTTLGPGGGAFGMTLGAAVTAVALVSMVQLIRESDRVDARVALTAVIVLGLAATTVGRTYWGLTFAPVLACYAAMGVRWLPERFRPGAALAPPRARKAALDSR